MTVYILCDDRDGDESFASLSGLVSIHRTIDGAKRAAELNAPEVKDGLTRSWVPARHGDAISC